MPTLSSRFPPNRPFICTCYAFSFAWQLYSARAVIGGIKTEVA